MITFAALLMLQSTAPAPAPAPPAVPACTGAPFDQFDFWVGEWEVYPRLKDPARQDKAPLIARSRIERLYAGCAIRENWMPLKGTGGGSLNAVDPATGRWHQTWIGSQPGRVEFDGGRVGQAMVLTGWWAGVNGPGQDALIRMSYTPIDQDTVRQHGEQSTDHGLTWSDNFDFIYRRAKPAG
jgi:hypothetical protein